MELSYLYIKDINRPIKDFGINFSSKFDITYNAETKTLKIQNKSKCVDNKLLYGSNIDNIKLLVGKNGVGKSTIMKLLGYDSRSRREDFKIVDGNGNTTDNCWFAIYHLYENRFVVEGYFLNIAFDVDNIVKGQVNNDYSIIVTYDFDTYKMKFESFIQYAKDINNSIVYLKYHSNDGLSWLNSDFHNKRDDITFSFERKQLTNAGYSSITKYLFESNKFCKENISDINNVHGCSLSIMLNISADDFFSEIDGNFSDKMEDGKKNKSVYIYGKEGMCIEHYINYIFEKKYNSQKFNNKHSYIIMYLQEMLVNIIHRYNDYKSAFSELSAYVETGDNFEKRQKYLLDKLKHISELTSKSPVDYISINYELIEKTVKGLMEIPDCYFVSDQKIYARFVDLEKNYFEILMKAIDDNVDRENIEFLYFLKFNIVGLSSGEARYLNLFAILYEEIATQISHKEEKKIILLLDEPDARFHPEWSRNFIERICSVLNSELFDNYRYQLIITSHSPFMISDVYKEDVILIDRKDNKIEVKNSQYGLMSSINDILVDSFFTESLFGSNAVKYVKKIIDAINDKENFKSNTEKIKLWISNINDDYIKLKLYRQFQSMKTQIELEEIE